MSDSSVSKPPPSKKARTFNSAWLETFPWLKKSEKDGAIRMLCDTCIRAKATNPFTDGCTNFQKSTLTRHQDSKSHADSVKTLQLRTQFQSAMQNVKSKHRIEKSNVLDGYVKQLRTVYCMVKRDVAADIFPDFMHVQVLNGITNVDSYYKRPQVISEFEECIERVVAKQLLDKINASEFIGIMLDETCDITVAKKLAVYVKYIENGEAYTSFLGNECITDSTAAGIETALIDLLKKKGICDECVTKIMGLGTDGASVMTGRLNGLGAKLKRRNKHLVQVHCVAHRLNLAVSQAGKSIDYCKQYHGMIHSIYQFYSDSSVRYDKLRELQTLLYEKVSQITEPTSVRWLSIEAAVKMLFSNYDAIFMALESDDKSPKAVGLFKFISNSLFLLFTAMLIDVLVVIGLLSKTFQKDSVNLSHIRHSVKCAQDTLNAMKDGSDKVNEVLEEIGEVSAPGEKSKYHDLMITDNQPMRHRFSRIRETYIAKLLENLDDRFPLDDLGILSCFDTIFNPSRYPDNVADIPAYGEDELRKINEHYSDLLDTDRTSAHFLYFKHFARGHKQSLSFEAFAKLIIHDCSEQYPDFVLLAKVALVIPVSSAPCERGFSIQNAIKTKVRNRLNPVRLNRLMFIKLVGPEIDHFDFAAAAQYFTDMKDRQ